MVPASTGQGGCGFRGCQDKTTSQAFGDMIDAGRRPGAPQDRLAEWTREAPLTVVVAFLFGMLVGQRR
jgi:hypothetical protein